MKVPLAEHVAEGVELHAACRAWARSNDEGDQLSWVRLSAQCKCQGKGEEGNPQNEHHWASRDLRHEQFREIN